jgi:hypothetical protein
VEAAEQLNMERTEALAASELHPLDPAAADGGDRVGL